MHAATGERTRICVCRRLHVYIYTDFPSPITTKPELVTKRSLPDSSRHWCKPPDWLFRNSVSKSQAANCLARIDPHVYFELFE
ncbi:hypothetical protein CEXT_19431 [Caerostris extrusa]|uniref:Uncharacterized protein n=1 Tax=Caerostris extrusa TaxID=172846 RepID=A0AAV4Y688_CAEEX|nr:hypothetical protein CEXT_19431 [Caerostris extrusa]